MAELFAQQKAKQGVNCPPLALTARRAGRELRRKYFWFSRSKNPGTVPPMFFRPLPVVLCALALAFVARGAEAPLSYFDKVDIDPAKTSLYLGSVTMTMPTFARKNGVYDAPYSAKLFPYFFLNEKGRLFVEVSDEMLRKLERGEPIEFKGRAVRDDGVERRVEGKATPADAASGKIKVRVFVTKKLELIFNTTYRFTK